MQEIGVSYAPGVATAFSRATNGYPFLIHVLGEKLFEAVRTAYVESDGDPDALAIDLQVWNHVRQQFLRLEATGRFERLWAANWLDPDDKGICIALAKEEARNRADQEASAVQAKDVVARLQRERSELSDAQIIRRIEFLEERGIILRSVSGSTESTFRVAVPLMAEWLQNEALEYVLPEPASGAPV
jgi:hypothetical protein